VVCYYSNLLKIYQLINIISLFFIDKHFYLDRDTVQKLAQHCNVKKEASLAAREQSKLLSLALYFVHKQDSQQPQVNHQAVITGTKVTTTVYGEARVIAVMEDYFDVSLPEFGMERRIHLANLPLWRHQYDLHDRALTMFWKQGVIPSTGLQQQWSLSDDEYEEEELLSTYPEHSQSNTSSSTNSSSNLSLENNKQFEAIALAAAKAGIVSTPNNGGSKKSATKRASIISSRLSASTGYSSEQSSQTIKALDKIRVMLTIEMVRTPPLIRVFAANPYA
jgi:protein SSD1